MLRPIDATAIGAAFLITIAGSAADARSATDLEQLRVVRLRAATTTAGVRAVVSFAGGRLKVARVAASDTSPARDGIAAIRVLGTAAGPSRVARAGDVAVRARSNAGMLRVEFRSALGRYKYLGYTLKHRPERVVVDLWKATPPATPLRSGAGHCLVLSRWSVTNGQAAASGTERKLFEHMFAVRVRSAAGGLVGTKNVAATRGRWAASIGYKVLRRQAGTLEAVDFSEGDGSLVCLAQVRVTLTP